MMEPYVAAGPVADSVSTPVKIRMNSHPTYNEEARRNNVTGDVRLLVFFQANGKIGMIFPLSELPFGLTDSSMRAAREITFVPATHDGKPITVARVVEYGFSIY